MQYKAIIAGANGLIGSNLLNILLDAPEYSEVLIIVRKEIAITHKKLIQLVINFDQLDNYTDAINGHALFCCLGTTNSKTPDKAVYRKIDHDYPLQLAQIAEKNGVSQFHLVSSIGADASSSTFYIRLKGETEKDIGLVKLKTLHIYQPSFLAGERSEKRSFEKLIDKLMKIIDPLLIGGLEKYRSIPAKTVAFAMYKKSLNTSSGTFIHPSDKIHII